MAIASIATIRAGLNTRLATISNLQTFAYLPAQPPMPCAFVGGPTSLTYHDSMAQGLNILTISVWVLVSTATPTVEGQSDLDEFVSSTGTNSIRAAIEGSTSPQTLSGTVADVVVDQCTGYTIYTTESGSYFGAEFSCRVFAAT
jgi:hypothetical protein